MAGIDLAAMVRDIPPLRGLVITAMPDCLVFDAWKRGGEGWRPEDVASLFGDAMRAHEKGLKALGAWSASLQIAVESADVRVVLRDLPGGFVAGFVFERDAAPGQVRTYVDQIADRLGSVLPSYRIEARPRGVRVLEFLQRYAPDPHAVLLRVALKTGIPVETLVRPETLQAGQVHAVERCIADILGMEDLRL